LEFVGVNFGSWLYQFAHDLFGDVVFAIWNNLSANLSATHEHAHDHGFTASALHAAIATHALTLRLVHESRFAANESFIDFD
jgi:hypothetical protein